MIGIGWNKSYQLLHVLKGDEDETCTRSLTSYLARYIEMILEALPQPLRRREIMDFSDPLKRNEWLARKCTDHDNIAYKLASSHLYKLGLTSSEISQILGLEKTEELSRPLSPEQRIKISSILSIDDSLKRLLYKERDRIEWLCSSNRTFDGASPKSLVLSGSIKNLDTVRAYLEGQSH